jgi:succinate dehydrogenase/fumarate reductase flavoprotein subunit
MAYRIGAEISGKEFIDFHWTHWKDPADMYDNWKGVLGEDLNAGTDLMAGAGALDLVKSVDSGSVPLLMSSPGGGSGGGSRPEGSRPDGESSGGARPEGESSGGARPEGESSGGDARPDGESSGGAARVPAGIRDVTLPLAGGATAGMSPHKCEGIFPQNGKCESSIKGLYAAGDALCTGGAQYHGVGCSSSASAVQGGRAGQYAAEYAATAKAATLSSTQKKEIATRMFGPRTSEQGFSPEWVTQVLQGMMVPYYVLYIKSGDRLKAALTNVQHLRDKFSTYLIASNAHELRQAHELKNMILNSEMKLRAALERTESRGSHYREDFPKQDDKNWVKWIVISKDGDNMKLTKKDVPDEWKL